MKVAPQLFIRNRLVFHGGKHKGTQNSAGGPEAASDDVQILLNNMIFYFVLHSQALERVLHGQDREAELCDQKKKIIFYTVIVQRKYCNCKYMNN
jgi:hypothetical protein